MLYISQGHERGIGLEILLKSFPLLTKTQKKEIILCCNKKTLIHHLKVLKIKHTFSQDNLIYSNNSLKCYFNSTTKVPESTASLIDAMEMCDKRSKLITLPTSKDQLILNKKMQSGHTDFFREYYKNNNISMMFYANNLKVLLITDHLAIKEVPKKITTSMIVKKVQTTVDGYEHYFEKIDEVIFSGINPHAGENGLLGKEDIKVTNAISTLKKEYKRKKILGPFAGDSLLTKQVSKNIQLFVYMFHDQGLSAFKALNQYYGINISFGLPYLRLSVDHGTAFELFGKNKANYMSLYYLFKSLSNYEK